MDRYSIIKEKNPREIVLLRGGGCAYKKCTFCDYHLDRCSNEDENTELNRAVLQNVTGQYGDLEVINSGSVFELGEDTMREIERICAARAISTLHFESHYLYRSRIPALRDRFSAAGVTLKMKLGLETFDRAFREDVLHKGIDADDPEEISRGFDEANFLFGIKGQTAEGMKRDIALGLTYFERICVNIMCPNTTPVKPDEQVIASFMADVYPLYRDEKRVDILLNNTDFGVGE